MATIWKKKRIILIAIFELGSKQRTAPFIHRKKYNSFYSYFLCKREFDLPKNQFMRPTGYRNWKRIKNWLGATL